MLQMCLQMTFVIQNKATFKVIKYELLFDHTQM